MIGNLYHHCFRFVEESAKYSEKKAPNFLVLWLEQPEEQTTGFHPCFQGCFHKLSMDLKYKCEWVKKQGQASRSWLGSILLPSLVYSNMLYWIGNAKCLYSF